MKHHVKLLKWSLPLLNVKVNFGYCAFQNTIEIQLHNHSTKSKARVLLYEHQIKWKSNLLPVLAKRTFI